ncbi:MAG: peptide deformylase [Anaerolineae bacterium]
MAVLPIVKHPNDEILRKKTIKVIDFGPKFQKLIDDMIETVIDAPGVGLAAPQVASKERVIVVRLPDDEESRKEYGDQAGVLYVVANPKIVKSSKEMVEGVEACLSIPGWFGKVDRYEGIVITGQDRHGKEIRIKAKDWLARVFQHEIDHLDGRLYIDIASEIWESKPDDEEQQDAGEGRKPRRFRIRRTSEAE